MLQYIPFLILLESIGDKMSEIAISIIVPLLNVISYVDDCIESIINQSIEAIEILCIDAGSTDGTFEKLLEFKKKDKRIKVFKSSVKSYGYQINLGIDLAKGKYIGIVESDDYIDKKMMEALYKKANKNNVDFIKSGYNEFLSIDSKKMFFDCAKSIVELHVNLNDNRFYTFYDLFHIWSGLYKREFILKNRLRLNETQGASYQDTSFSILCGLLAESCIYVNESYYFYRIDNINSSVKCNDKWHCIIDEYEYIKSEMINRNLYFNSNKIMILKQKLLDYELNYERLPKSYREKFFKAIQYEMKEYIDNSDINNSLTEDEKRIVNLLTEKDEINKYERDIERIIINFKDVFKKIEKERKFVIVGAGNYGAKFLFLETILNKNYIRTICDNSKDLMGRKKGKYTIMSLEEATDKYKEDLYIIANKKHYKEIHKQLESLGIKNDSILIFNKMISTYDLVQLFQQELLEDGKNEYAEDFNNNAEL